MSTKTTLKRIALVAVSALGFGLLSVAPSQAAISISAPIFAPDTYKAITSSPSGLSYNYTVTQDAGASNYVQFNAVNNVQDDELTGIRAVVTGGTLRTAGGAAGTCNDTDSPYVSSTRISTTYSAGVWSAGVTASGTPVYGTRLLASDVVVGVTTGATACDSTNEDYDTVTSKAPAFFTIGTATAGTIKVEIYGDELGTGAGGGVVSSTLLQTLTINVLPVAASTFTSAKTIVEADNDGYYNPYEGVYGPKTAGAGRVGFLTVNQYAGAGLITNVAELKTITVTMSGPAGSLDANVPGASFMIFTNTLATLAQSQEINVYPDGRGGESTVTVTVNGVVNSVTKFWFYGQAASITASAVLGVGRASSTGNRVTGALKYQVGCIAGTEVGCNTAVGPGVTVGNASAPEDPAELNNVAVAVLVKDANGIPMPAPVTGTSSNLSVVSDARYSWLLDSGASDYSAGTYYQHITYQTPINSVSGGTANLTYSVVNPDGTVITSNAVAVKLGGAPLSANVKMTTDKSSYMPGEAGVITITATDSLGNTPYDGSAPFTKVEANTALFTGKIPTTATVLTNGKATTNFFAPAVPGKWTITATLGDGVTTLTLPVTVGADTSAIDAAADAAAEAIDAANAATDAANLAAEAADAATVAAEEARDAADAATAAVEELATEVAALFAALKAQLTTLANTVAKIAKKVKA